LIILLIYSESAMREPRRLIEVPAEVPEPFEQNQDFYGTKLAELQKKYGRAVDRGLSTAMLIFYGSAGFVFGKIVDQGGGVVYNAENVALNYAPTRKFYEEKILDVKPLADSLRSEIGNGTVDYLETVPSVRNQQERDETIQRDLKEQSSIVINFGTTKIGDAKVKDVIDQTVPNVLRAEAPIVTVTNKELRMNEDYNLAKEDRAAAFATRSHKKIVFNKNSADRDINWSLDFALMHEMFHQADWISNSSLTHKERLQLLQATIDRVQSPDRYKSSYVEEIKNRNKQIELLNKATEYFAEIGGMYMSKDFHLLPKADRDLVASFINKFDPKFDRAAAAKKRAQIINRKAHKGNAKHGG
jgi:hypothetical protein